jgi:O-antigen/teichoic acid export membrane protein/glycosyltransferase involved in cell wall biosynthesis
MELETIASGVSLKPFNTDGSVLSPFKNGDGELRRLTVRGAGATLAAGVVTLSTQIIGTMILARLLTPADFGLITMVTTFSLLVANLGFNGLTEAIVQCDEIDHALASTLFWINAACGILLTIGFAEAGSLLARFYHDPLVQRVTVFVSLTIFASSISTVHLALLKRAMHFSWVSLNDICSRAVSVILSIFLGWLGWGYWALVVGVIAVPVSTSVGAFLLCRWMPGFPRKVAGTGPLLRFALNTYGNFSVNYLSRNTDNLLVGWRFNAQSLGFYKKAYDLFALSANQLVASIAVVVVAALSRVRKDPVLYRRYVIDALAVMAFVGMGLGAGLTLVGKDLIFVLLGPKWGPAGRIFAFFGPGIGIMILYGTHGWIHLSLGRADRWFRWAIVEFLVTFLLFIGCLQWGPVGIAIAWSASFWILTIPAIWYAGRPIGLEIGSVLSMAWRFVLASLVAALVTHFAVHQFPSMYQVPGMAGALFRIAVVSTFIAFVYLGSVVLLHGGFAPLLQIAGLLGEMVRSGKSASTAESHATDEGAATHAVHGEQALSKELPLISILIPAYSAQEWIADTIHSAIAQTWPRTEIIVVDDGSSDSTLAIARTFESQGVRVISQKNQGASAARNTAFLHSRGDYIQWLDADDLLAPDKIAKQMEIVMQGLSPRTLLSSAWAHFMYRPRRAEFIPSELWCDLAPKEWLLRKMEENIYMQTATWLVSREVTEAAGPWDIRMIGDDDGEYFCRVLLASDGVRFVPEAKVYYRAFQFASLSYIGRFPHKIEAHWNSMQLHIRYLRSFGDDARVRAACLQFLRDSLIYFYPETSHIVAEAEKLAVELGEPLGAPGLSWKYAWIEVCFGWFAVKPTQNVMRKIRWGLATKLDYLLFRLEDHRHPQIPKPSTDSDVAGGSPGQLAAKESRII